MTVWGPRDEVGITKVALKVPVAVEVTVAGEVVCVTPSNLTVIVEVPAKPVPDTVTVPPTMLLGGLRLIDAVTVNEAEAV